MTLRLGSQGDLVVRWQKTMVARFAGYAKAADGGPLKPDGYFGYDDRDVQREYERRTGQLVDGIVSDDDLRALGLLPPDNRPVVLTFRGTGGVIGHDYTSRVAQFAGFREVAVEYPATMGGIPVGAATRGPTGGECVEIAVQDAVRSIEGSDWPFILCGYSLGAIAASRVRAMLEPGGRLAPHKHRYICGVMFGNPARQFGHTYYLGAVPAGYGIADWHLPQPCCTWDWCELADPGDIYTNAPGGEAGDVMRAAYRIVMGTQVADPIVTIRRILPHIIELIQEAGVRPDVPLDKILTGAGAGLLAAVLPVDLANLLRAGSTETAGAVQAAILALRFFADGTRPHIEYEHREVWPGQTYLGLAVQHVQHWWSEHQKGLVA